MPNRNSIGPSAASTTTSGSSRNDIMMHAAAAASAYGSKLISKNSSKQNKDTDSTKQTLDDSVTPGAHSYTTQMYNPKPLGEHLTSDLNELKKQYIKLKERQRQAHIIVQGASDQHRRKLLNKSTSSPPLSSNNSANLRSVRRSNVYGIGSDSSTSKPTSK